MLTVDSIFFDVDGTLVDSKKDIATAVNYALKSLGLEVRPEGEVYGFIGSGTKDLVRKSLGAENAASADKALEAFSKYYAEHSAENTVLYPHAKEILEYFKDKKKYILTNRYKRFAEITLKTMGIRDYFLDIIGGDDENCLKPSTCAVDPFISGAGIDPSRALIVGDMSIDIQTGINAGIKTCWVTYGLGKTEDVLPLKPDLIIDDLIELKGVVK